MERKKCNFCGSTGYEQRRTDYLYSYKGSYLLVPNTPVEIISLLFRENMRHLIIIWKFRSGLILDYLTRGDIVS